LSFLLISILPHLALAIQNPLNVRTYTGETPILVGDGAIQVSWSNPPDQTYAGTLCVGSESPISWVPETGIMYSQEVNTLVADGVRLLVNDYAIGGYRDNYLEPGKPYYYKVWCYDADLNYSTGVSVNDTPAGNPPAIGNCTDVTVDPSDAKVHLKWSNPPPPAYKVTLVARSSSDIDWQPVDGMTYAAGETIGEIVVLSAGDGNTFYIDSDLQNGMVYHYAVFAATESHEYAVGVRVSAVPVKKATTHYYRLLNRWGESGSGPGQFSPSFHGPQAISVFDNRVLVADPGNWRVEEFDRVGALLNTDWDASNTFPFRDTLYQEEIQEMEYLAGTQTGAGDQGPKIAISFARIPGITNWPDVMSFTADSGFRDYDREFPGVASGISLCYIRQPFSGLVPYDLLYVAVAAQNKIYRLYGAGLVTIDSWGTTGTSPGQISGPLSIVEDYKDAFVYVGDQTGRIQKFSRSGVFQGIIQTMPLNEMPMDMDVDAHGNFYVLSSAYYVYKFDKDWNSLGGWGGFGSEAGKFLGVGRICVDDSGLVYVTDPVACQVNQFYETDVNGTDVTFTAYAAEPVNTRTGYYVYEHTDLEVPDIGRNFEFTRTSNSGDHYFGILGYGWRNSFDLRVSRRSDSSAVVQWGDGREDQYEFNGSAFVPQVPSITDTLTFDSNTTYTLTRKDLSKYEYNAQGRISSILDKNGNKFSFHYNGLGRLMSVQGPSGRSYSFMYHPFGFLASFEDPLGRQFTYQYDTSGHLTGVVDARGAITTYEYDSDHRIVRVIDARGTETIANTYDEDTEYDWDRVTTQMGPLGETTAFEYKTMPLTTAFGDVNVQTGETELRGPESEVTVYKYDGLGRLIEQIDPDGEVTAYDYSAADNRTKIVDRNGNATEYAYDARGNMIQKTDPLGHTVTIGYNSLDLPISRTDELGYTTFFEYDSVGNLLKETDPLDGITTYSYDSRGLLTAVSDPLGHITRYEYDSQGNAITTVDPRGNETVSVYDVVGRRISRIDSFDNVTRYAYDANNNLTSQTNAIGETTIFVYDANNNRTETHYADGSVRKFTYDEHDRVSTEIDQLGRITTYQYDAYGRNTMETDDLGNSIQYTYDSRGNMTSQTDKNGNVTEFDYDANGNRIMIMDPLGNVTLQSYDVLNRLSAITNPLGGAQINSYDAVGNILVHTDESGSTSTYTYDALGRKYSTTNAKRQTNLFTYDSVGRLMSEANALGEAYQYEYDENGNRTSVTDPLNHTTKYTYDALNRLVAVEDALGNKTKHEYDALGRRVASIDALDSRTEYLFDIRGRLVSVTDAGGKMTTYDYDEVGNVVRFTNARQKTTSYSYDALNRLTSETTPMGFMDVFAYDPVGNRVSHTGPDDLTTEYGYDSNNRLVSIEYPDSKTVQNVYDANGQRVSMTDSFGTALYSYDQVGRLVQSIDPFNQTVLYSYDRLGKTLSVTYPDGLQVHYEYDTAGRLASVTDWNSYMTSYEYDANGRLTTETLPNGVVSNYKYDTANRVIRKGIRNDTGGLIATYELTLDSVGNRTKIEKSEPFPEVFNRPLETIDYTYDDDDRIMDDGTGSYLFDERGRLVQRSTGQETYTFSYNYMDRLITLTEEDGAATFRYDGNGSRLESEESSTTTRFVLDQSGEMTWVLCETSESGHVTRHYVYGHGLISCEIAGSSYFYHFDPLGSTVGMSNQAGIVVNKYVYSPFGERLAFQEMVENHYQYLGRHGVQRERMGLYYARARYYDAKTGRFLSRDLRRGTYDLPISRNRYIYALQNPVMNYDPSGMESIPFIGTVQGAVVQSIQLTTDLPVGLAYDVLGFAIVAWDIGHIESDDEFADYLAHEGFGLGGKVGVLALKSTGIVTGAGASVAGVYLSGLVAIPATLVAIAYDTAESIKHGFRERYIPLIEQNRPGYGGGTSQSVANAAAKRDFVDHGRSAQGGRQSSQAFFGSQAGLSRGRSKNQQPVEVNVPYIYERYEPKYILINKSDASDLARGGAKL
jgi:RHS repeat-associated protein